MPRPQPRSKSGAQVPAPGPSRRAVRPAAGGGRAVRDAPPAHARSRQRGRSRLGADEGGVLLSDPWFRENVTRILTEEELQIRPEWFAGKRVLDAGCGRGRWSYGFASLGTDVTSVDVNPRSARPSAPRRS